MSDDISIDEKRVYGDRTGAVDLAVATEMGVVRVAVSGEQVGEFGLALQTNARDITAAPVQTLAGSSENESVGGVAVATDEDILLGDPETLTATGFGPAVAVGRNDHELLAADESGRIARWDGSVTAAGELEGAWEDLATVDAEIRAIDGDLVAASDGVHRFTTSGLQPAGLDDAFDVAAGMVPHAATKDGLYHLGNGWMDVLEGEFRVVEITTDSGGTASGGIGRGHAATPDAFFEHRGGEWVERDVPGRVTDVAHGPRDYAITEDGMFLLRRDDGWYARSLGIPGAVGLALVAGTAE